MEKIETPIVADNINSDNNISTNNIDGEITFKHFPLLQAPRTTKPWDKQQSSPVPIACSPVVVMPPKPEFTFKLEVNPSCNWSELANSQQDEW